MSAGWDALRGKPVVIEFWGTWCGNCAAEIPRLNELVTKFPDIRFLSITDEQLAVVEPFLTKRPILGWVGLDRPGSTFQAYGIEARPQTMLADRDGILRGVMHPAQVVEAVLADLVAGWPVKPAGLESAFAHVRGQDRGPGLRRRAAQAAWRGRTTSSACAMIFALDILRDMLERTLKLKIRREARPMDVFVLKRGGAKPRESPGAWPMNVLAGLPAYRVSLRAR